jgi:signal transduction histidine kinase
LTVVPILVRTASLGLLGALPHPERDLGPEAVQLLTTVGTQLGLAVDSHRMFTEARRRADLFRLISDVGGLITSARSLDELLKAIVTSIHDRLGYALVDIGLIEDGQVAMKYGVGGEWDRPNHQPPRFVIGEQGLIGWCAAAGESVLAPDVQADHRYVPLPESDRIRSELVVPLRSGDEVLGVLDVQSEQLHAFTGVDRAVLESLAAQAAVAMVNMRLGEQARRMAVLEERTRIARDLHDAVSQTLWTTGLVADVLPDLWRTNRPEARRSLGRIQQLTRGALAELRMLLLELRPAALADADLGLLLRQLADGTASRKRLRIVVQSDGPTELPVEVKIGLYRIAQEALANVVKHAGATQVGLLLETQGCAVQLRIEDNGCPVAPPGGQAAGLGLQIMRERAESVAAELHVTPAPGGGTRVEVRWPAQGVTHSDDR